MRGEIIGVWADTWREIWSKLAKHPEYGDDIFPDLYRELVPEPLAPPAPPVPQEFDAEGQLVLEKDIEARNAYLVALRVYEHDRANFEVAVSGGPESRGALNAALKANITTEAKAIEFLETAFRVFIDYGDDGFLNKYYSLVGGFLDKFNLRYDLRRPFSLHPTLPGMFAGLHKQLKGATDRDTYLQTLMHEFEESLRDLKTDQSGGKIKTCIQKQVNLLEAMGRQCPGVRPETNSLSRICEEVGTWPHERLKDSMKKTYAFTCDYPGIRHAGTPANSLRNIEMRDLVAVCILLAGFTPYLTDQIDSNTIYSGT